MLIALYDILIRHRCYKDNNLRITDTVNGKFTYDKCFKYVLCSIKQKLLTLSLFLLPILMMLFYEDLSLWANKLYASL